VRLPSTTVGGTTTAKSVDRIQRSGEVVGTATTATTIATTDGAATAGAFGAENGI
jgi:hypothetical protein